MKRYSPFLFASLLAVLFLGCAQWGGDNPLGITGGSKEGYGQHNDLNLPDGSGEIDPDLVGVWSMYDYPDMLVYTFMVDGTFKIELYYYDSLDETTEGTWNVYGNQLTLRPDGGRTEVVTYQINGNQLTLTQGDYVLILHRGQVTL
jgi:hypothetical protein